MSFYMISPHMNTLERYLLVFITLLACHVAQAQSDVNAHQEGRTIVVTYQLSELSDVRLLVSDNGTPEAEIPLAYLKGDVGKRVTPGPSKKIIWNVLEQYEKPRFQGNLQFKVKGVPSSRFFVGINGGYSMDSGIMAGLSFGQLTHLIGWYGKAMTTLSFPHNAAYECDASGRINGVLPAYSGTASTFKAFGVAGLTLRLARPVYLNVGVGYGMRQLEWEMIDGTWVKNGNGSYGNVAVDAGLILRFNHIGIMAGATYIPITHVDFSLGLCFAF